MKTSYYLSALAAAGMIAMTSCSDEVQGVSVSMDNAIEVRAMVGTEVNARALTSAETTTANIANFFMNAYDTNGNAIISTDATGKGKFQKSGNKWTDGNVYYWPTGNIKFMAVACSDGTQPSGITVSNSGITAEDFSVEASGETYAQQKDYVAAVLTSAKPAEGNAVSLHFQHLLSRVSINAYAPHIQNVTLRAFQFDNVGTDGSFAFTGSSTAENFAPTCWTGVTTGNVGATTDVWGLAAAIPTADELVTTYGKLSAATPWLNVIPGTDVSDKLSLLLTTGTGTAAKSKVVTVDLPEGLIENLAGTADDDTYLPGYQYVYNVKVTGQDGTDGEIEQVEIEIENVTVTPWKMQELEWQNSPTLGIASFKDLVESAEQYSTIRLLSNLQLKKAEDETLNAPIHIKKNITLDLNGFDIDATNDIDAMFIIDAGAKLTVIGSGKLTAATGKQIFAFDSNAQLFLKGGTYNQDISDFVADGYEAQTYAVDPDVYWWKVQPVIAPIP